MIDFFFVGPSKTASTWLYQALSEHPEFSLPKAKDVYFFDQFFDKGVEWYHKQFKGCDFSKHVGDFSHDYLICFDALKRIKDYNESAKILVCIRNPYERTESGIRFLQRNGHGFGRVEELINKHTELVEGSLYGRNISELYKIFEKEQVLLLEYDTLKADPVAFLTQIYEFLGVSYFSPSVLGKVVNKARPARSRKLSYLVKKCARLVRRLGLSNLVGSIKMNPIVNRLLYKDAEPEFALTQSDKKLLSRFFDKDIDLLSEITEKDYSAWKYKE